jgi:geranylgeranyl diphosphate synthase type I
MGNYSPRLDDLRKTMDDELARFLGRIRDEQEQSDPLLVEIETLLDAGGKRLRPAFCYWGARAAGSDHSTPLLRVASSLELLHTFALVHDDIMDASDERRGVPTVHLRLGVGTALLVGDLALVLADDLFMTSGFEADALRRAFESYSRMRKQVIVGQHMELMLAAQDVVEEEEARLVARMKSGRYSIKEPLLIGGCLGPRAGEVAAGLSEFGELLGEAFQIRDDLLGTFGRRPETGKPVDSDIREGKKNILFALTLQRLEGEQREFFLGRWGGGVDLSDDDVGALRDLIEDSGGRAATEDLLEDLKSQALDVLGTLPLDGEARGALEDLTEDVTKRSA